MFVSVRVPGGVTHHGVPMVPPGDYPCSNWPQSRGAQVHGVDGMVLMRGSRLAMRERLPYRNPPMYALDFAVCERFLEKLKGVGDNTPVPIKSPARVGLRTVAAFLADWCAHRSNLPERSQSALAARLMGEPMGERMCVFSGKRLMLLPQRGLEHGQPATWVYRDMEREMAESLILEDMTTNGVGNEKDNRLLGHRVL